MVIWNFKGRSCVFIGVGVSWWKVWSYTTACLSLGGLACKIEVFYYIYCKTIKNFSFPFLMLLLYSVFFYVVCVREKEKKCVWEKGRAREKPDFIQLSKDRKRSSWCKRRERWAKSDLTTVIQHRFLCSCIKTTQDSAKDLPRGIPPLLLPMQTAATMTMMTTPPLAHVIVLTTVRSVSSSLTATTCRLFITIISSTTSTFYSVLWFLDWCVQ